nr:hypothetical protein [uncultured Rhodopila sp.]
MSGTLTQNSATTVPSAKPKARRFTIGRWLLHELPYIVMLVAGLSGALLHLPVSYWLLLVPAFGLITIVAGWNSFPTALASLSHLWTQVFTWGALMFAIYVLYSSGTQVTLLNANANPQVIMTLVALGTFIGGVQARLWQTCAVGIVLFLAVPSITLIHQSALLLVGISIVIIIVGGLTWTVSERRQGD